MVARVVAHAAPSDSSYGVTGPVWPIPDEASLYKFLAFLWKQSSLQMKHLCDAGGIRYAHFLQPNQYIEGSKPMTAAERKIAPRLCGSLT